MENFMSKIYHYKRFTKFTRYDKRLAERGSECLSHDLNTVPIYNHFLTCRIVGIEGGKFFKKLVVLRG